MPEKKTVKKTANGVKAEKPAKMPNPVGVVTHFYNKIGVAIVKFKEAVPTGTKVMFKGATTDFKETIDSIQLDHEPLDVAPKGKQVGIKVKEAVREGDQVYPAK